MVVSLIILKFQSILAEGNRISASLLALPSLTTHYYAAVLSHLCSEMEMAFHPRWASFHNAKKAFQRGSLTIARLCAITMDWDKKKRETGEEKEKLCRNVAMSAHSASLGDFLESFWDQNSSVHDSSCPLYRSGLMACCFFLLQRWGLSPDRGIRIVILLRFCWIGVYCFDLCNDTYFFKMTACSISSGDLKWWEPRSSHGGGGMLEEESRVTVRRFLTF